MKQQLEYAMDNQCTVCIYLNDGKKLNGKIESVEDLGRVKVRCPQEVYWIPYTEIKNVLLLIENNQPYL